ncbi:Hsp70 family protein [Robbsia sp. Bb-Pol-6]|uniref:Hsp70 family protein n=1 Tax=Robbsia betulipollinis TaxID=2981849 RepID=A0ABT3ZNU2_9BURK|nr:Hsp70 family protein [Robbsia betulipollinis]MCY0388214.1 Hsp70 family protein [Robbsia betulipollinis]
MTFCAIDFGTSNSALALPTPPSAAAPAGGSRLIALEGAQPTLPTAVFFNADEHTRAFGRAAIAEYIDGYEGRLMRSLKSILGSPLALGVTELGDGSALPFLDIIALFLDHLLQTARRTSGAPVTQAVMGRPVFFVDDDPQADAEAQAQLEAAARSVGLRDVVFQYEPIAAAFDYESGLSDEQIVLVVDIGGGTSDFSLVRVGPGRAARLDRRDDVLGHHGVHVAGTDIDKRVALASVMRELGYRSTDVEGREIPNRIYFDLSTWHLVNTIYGARRIAEFKLMRHIYRDEAYPARLERVFDQRLGHALIGLSEGAKIAVSAGGDTSIDLGLIEEALCTPFDGERLAQASAEETQRIVAAALDTARQAGIRPEQVGALYFTGGSTGLKFLSTAISAAFPAATAVHGDPLASVAKGLGIYAERIFR